MDNWQQDIGAQATNPASKTWLQKCLTAQRALKADYLRGHPTVLRKSTKVTGDPAPKGLRVMTPDLSDDEKRALAELLTRTIANDRYPPSPRIQI